MPEHVEVNAIRTKLGMTQRRYAISVALPLFLLAPLAARQDKTDEFITAQPREQNIPGLALAIVKNGKVIKAEGYGYADLERKIPIAPVTVLKIASVSKQFIATGIMLLVQDGKLSVSDPVSKHITDAPAAWKGITIRHLLTHTAGLVREAPGVDISRFQPDIDVIRNAYDAPLHFAAGEKYQYSNVGYFILGEIIRRCFTAGLSTTAAARFAGSDRAGGRPAACLRTGAGK